MAKPIRTAVDLYQSFAERVDSSDYRTDDGTCIRTNAIDSPSFMEEFSKVLGQQMKVKESFVPYLRSWLEQAFDINCKLRGYKADQVNEQRILWAGNIDPVHQNHLAGSDEELILAGSSQST